MGLGMIPFSFGDGLHHRGGHKRPFRRCARRAPTAVPREREEKQHGHIIIVTSLFSQTKATTGIFRNGTVAIPYADEGRVRGGAGGGGA